MYKKNSSLKNCLSELSNNFKEYSHIKFHPQVQYNNIESVLNVYDINYIKLAAKQIDFNSIIPIIIKTKDNNYHLITSESNYKKYLTKANIDFGYILFPTQNFNKFSLFSLTRWLMKNIFDYFIKIILLSLFISYFQMMGSILSVFTINYLIPTNIKSNLLITTLIVILILCTNLILKRLLLSLSLEVGNRSKIYLISNFLSSILKQKNIEFSSGDISERVYELSNNIDILLNVIIELPYLLFSLILSCYIILLYNQSLAALYIIMAFTVTILQIILALYLRHYNTQLLQSQSHLANFLSDTLEAIDKIKAYRNENIFINLILRLQLKQNLLSFFKINIISNAILLKSLILIITNLSFLLIIKQNVKITSSDIIIFIIISSQLMINFTDDANKIIDLIDISIQIKRFNNIFIKNEQIEHNTTKYTPDITGNIRLSKLCFLRAKQEILSNISIELPPGNSLLVTGRSGSGKTTFIKIILGQITNYSGDIYFYNINI